MCRILALLVVSGMLAAVVTTSAQQPPEKVSAERVKELIDKLGSNKFAEREKAMKELEALGPQVLPELKPALKSTDAEIKGRVELLVRRLEDQQMAASLGAGKRVRLNVKNVTVPEAVAELAKLSGYTLVLDSHAKEFGDLKVTLDTGETTFWEALRQLGLSAKLVEVSAIPSRAQGGVQAGAKKGGAAVVRPIILGAAPPVPNTTLHLALGTPADEASCVAGSIRIRLVNSKKLAKGDRELTFEVMNEPRLAGFTAASNPVILKAIDDKKQTLLTTVVPIPSVNNAPAAGVANNGIGNIGVGNGNGNGVGNAIILNGNMANTASVLAQPSFAPFQFTVVVKPGENPSKKLSELAGKLTVRTMVDTEPALVIDKILDAAGKTAKAKDGRTIKVNNIQKLANGDYAIQISQDDVLGQNGAGVGAIQIQGAANVQINGKNIVVGGIGTPQTTNPFRLVDAKGEGFTQMQSSNNGMSINAGQISYTQTLVFRPKAGQGAPAQLVLPGQRSFAFDVPFVLKDVLLP